MDAPSSVGRRPSRRVANAAPAFGAHPRRDPSAGRGPRAPLRCCPRSRNRRRPPPPRRGAAPTCHPARAPRSRAGTTPTAARPPGGQRQLGARAADLDLPGRAPRGAVGVAAGLDRDAGPVSGSPLRNDAAQRVALLTPREGRFSAGIGEAQPDRPSGRQPAPRGR